MAGKEYTSTIPKTKKSTNSRSRKDDLNGTYIYQEEEYPQVSDNNDLNNVSSNALFVLDHVGNKDLKTKFEAKKGELNGESNADNDEKTSTSNNLPSRTFDGDKHEKAEKTERVHKEKKNETNSEYSLSSSIETHLDKLLTKKYKTGIDKLLDKIKPAPDLTSEITERQKKKMNKKIRDKVCSAKWFNMKAPELTKNVKNQLSILRLREILDRKNFYKNNDRQKFPKFFQMGKVVESPADFYHARIPKKQRKATLLDEVMADADLKRYQKRKYAEIFGDAKKTRNKKRQNPISTN